MPGVFCAPGYFYFNFLETYFLTLHLQWPHRLETSVMDFTSLKEAAPFLMAFFISVLLTLKQGHKYFSLSILYNQ